MSSSYLPEIWKRIKFDDNISENEVYEISTHGRVKSFKVDKKNGIIIGQSSFAGYKRIPLIQKNNKRTARYTHKLVAETFIEKTDEAQKYVIHLNYDKTNNNVWNLRWVTKKEKEEHQYKHPRYATRYGRIVNAKLTEGRVRMLKKKLFDPNRKTRLKMLAKQFGISEMQLHRIKTGENWGYVKVKENKKASEQ